MNVTTQCSFGSDRATNTLLKKTQAVMWQRAASCSIRKTGDADWQEPQLCFPTPQHGRLQCGRTRGCDPTGDQAAYLVSEETLSNPSCNEPTLPCIRAISKLLIEDVIPSNPEGWTFDLSGRRILEFGPQTNPNLFIVSRFGYEQQFRGLPSRQALEEWLHLHFAVLRRPGDLAGNWWWNGRFFLDVSVPILGFDAAIKFGKHNQQKAIFHAASGRSHSIDSAVSDVPTTLEPPNGTIDCARLQHPGHAVNPIFKSL